MPNLVLAHDLGTTGNKASLFDSHGRAVAGALAPYGTVYPRPGWAEQDPADWWDAVCASTRQLLGQPRHGPADVAVVSFSGQMMGCLPVDDEGVPLRRPNLLVEATSLGAAVAGGVGVGLWPDYAIVADLVETRAAETPNPVVADRYKALYDLSGRSYEALAPIYRELASLT